MKNFSYRTLVAVLIFGLLSFNIPLTPAKASVDDGLVAHWELDEATGTELEDSASGSTGSISGDVKHTLGKIGRALLFDENNQSANINSGTGELPTFSISFWLKTSDTSADAIISDNPLGFALVLCENGKVGVKPLVNNTMILCGSKKVNDNKWHHVLVTSTSGGLPDFFVDGVSAESGQWAWPATTLKKSTLQLNVTGSYKGYLDDVRIYDRALNSLDEFGNLINDDAGDLFAGGAEENETEPYLEFLTQPEDQIDVDHAEYTFVAQYETELTCSLDDIELDDCESPTNLTSLLEGGHTFKVTAFDELFNETTIEDTFNVNFEIPFVAATSTLSVVVNVINNDAGGLVPSNFTVSVAAGNPSNPNFSGSTNPTEVTIDAGQYNVTGAVATGYTLSYSNCSGVSLVGATVDCTLTYDDVFYVPNGGGQGGDNEGDGIIPNGQGSNVNEGEGIIPNGQGSNGHEGDPIVQGSNDNEIIPPVIDTEQLVIAEAQSNSSSGNSSSSTFKRSVPSNILPILTDIGSCTYINDYLNINDKNNPTEVTKLQTFLLNTEGIDVDVNGIFDETTLAAVKAFQTKYLDEVMLPWGLQTASGIVSYTTKKKINEIYCKSTFALTPAQLAAIERYRTSINLPDIEFQEPDVIEVGFAEPEIIEAPLITEQIEEVPVTPITQQTQTASALDASEGFFQRIANFFKNLF